jgi:DNA-binding NarL/FixJ family response regulator
VAPVRVLLVEDSDVYRASLELLLSLQDGIDVVGAVATGADAIEAADALRPDVALVDLRLAGMDGIELTARLRSTAPSTAVVCLTAEATDEGSDAVRTAGAVAVVGKEQPLEVLARVVCDAAADVEPA